jgi:hypothetical protein
MIEPRTERASRYVLAHAVTAREAAEMLDCTPGEVEALVQARILVGRHIKTARGRLWIVCAACVADLQVQPAEEREAAIAKAVAQATDEGLTD